MTAAPGSRALGCPACGSAMRALPLPRKPHGEVVVDLCPACRGLWFDAFESLQLTPAATLALFREVASLGPVATAAGAPRGCPRCGKRLAETRDLQRTTRFAYWRCADGHGRFTPFVQFMREKDFVRPLTRAEIDVVRAQIGTVRCSGCGAPVDLGAAAACGCCGAPVVALDPEAIRRVLDASHDRAPATGTTAPMDALLAAQAARTRAPASGVDLVFGGVDVLFDALGFD